MATAVTRSNRVQNEAPQAARQPNEYEHDQEFLSCLLWAAYMDFICCMSFFTCYAFIVVDAYKHNKELGLAVLTFLLFLVSAFTAFIAFVAVKWNSTILLWFWASLTTAAFIFSSLLNLLMPCFFNGTLFVVFIFFMIRMIFLLCTAWFATASLVHRAAREKERERNRNQLAAAPVQRPTVVSRPVSITYGYSPHYEASPGDVVIEGLDVRELLANNNTDRNQWIVVK